jgi:hypothetical protein
MFNSQKSASRVATQYTGFSREECQKCTTFSSVIATVDAAAAFTSRQIHHKLVYT